MLAGIELERPDEWWACMALEGRYHGYRQVSGVPCALPHQPELDCFTAPSLEKRVWQNIPRKFRRIGRVTVYHGVDGHLLGDGETTEEAIAAADRCVSGLGQEEFVRRAIGILETQPLSPRYAWKAKEDKSGDNSAY